LLRQADKVFGLRKNVLVQSLLALHASVHDVLEEAGFGGVCPYLSVCCRVTTANH
jgi:hypothetical protein